MQSLFLKDVIARFLLTDLTPGISTDDLQVVHTEINRPALQLAGFYEGFDPDRVQIIGKIENAYLQTLDAEKLENAYETLFSKRFLCLIICRGIVLPMEELLIQKANEYKVPVLRTERTTSAFMADLIRYLGESLAPSTLMHGVLVDCFGEGVLITGESGIGKSETALELIGRGHRLVADDVVEISKVSDIELVGKAPAVLENLIELRGIGILNVKDLFGLQSVKNQQLIDMVIRIENWEAGKEYNRLGIEETTEILGNQVICYNIPVRPGRNLAIIIESAAIAHRQKKMGYTSAIEELKRRVAQENNK